MSEEAFSEKVRNIFWKIRYMEIDSLLYGVVFNVIMGKIWPFLLKNRYINKFVMWNFVKERLDCNYSSSWLNPFPSQNHLMLCQKSVVQDKKKLNSSESS